MTKVESDAECILTYGYTLIPDLLTKLDIQLIIRSLLERDQSQALARDDWTRTSIGGVEDRGVRGGNQRISKATGIIPSLGHQAGFLVNDRLLDVVKQILGKYIRVSSEFGIITHPGNERGFWHCDWPYNQTVASHIPYPYPDAPMHLTCLFMLTDFSEENGGTLFISGSHKRQTNPTRARDPRNNKPYPEEQQAIGSAGSVFLYDARLWHAIAENRSDSPRLALAVRFAPWWLNLEVRRLNSVEYRMVCEFMDGRPSYTPELSQQEFYGLPDAVRSLFAHWVYDK